METITLCAMCQKPLGHGRPDRRFCSEGCRNAYHNAEKSDDNLEIKKVHLVLKRNRKIIKGLLGFERELIVDRDKLLKKGFEFDYHTHYVTSKAKSYVYTFCYNYGYRLMEDGRYKIVKGFDKF